MLYEGSENKVNKGNGQEVNEHVKEINILFYHHQ